MNAEKHLQIVIQHLGPSAKHVIYKCFIFQHEKYIVSEVKTYLDNKTHSGMQSVMDWPLQSQRNSKLLKWCVINKEGF